MTQAETRTGFRLPWAADAGDATRVSEPATSGGTTTSDTRVSPDAVAPEAEERTTPAMIETTMATGNRRPTKFLEELGRAMQAAAETSRDETLARLRAEEKAVAEEIQASSAVGAADVRRRADDDVAAVREWSKGEIARIREETEARIAARKSALEGEMEAQAAVIAARIEHVAATVAEFETRMTAFFERIRAEQDPTRIATMAEMMPEPPDLTGVAASVVEPAPTSFDPAAPFAASAVPVVGAPATVETGSGNARAVPDFAAAEAEAAAFTAELDGAADAALVLSARESIRDGRVLSIPGFPSPGPKTTSSVVVVGLVSVASIAAFKRSIGRIIGVSNVAVASSPEGEFVFTVTHDGVAGLADAIGGLPGFDAQVTVAPDGDLRVTAHDPDISA